MTKVLFGTCLLASALVGMACGPGGQSAGATGATGGAGPVGGLGGDGVIGATGGGGGVSTIASCPELPLARLDPSAATSSGVVELDARPFLGDRPLLFGEEHQLPEGGTVTPLNLRFYVSTVAVIRADGTVVPVDLLTAGGGLAPYGVHLFNAEDPSTFTLRLRAPAGEYRAFTFLLGLDVPCNLRSFGNSNPPLSADSQMTWPMFGYLFLRYEGRLDGLDGSAPGATVTPTAIPTAIQMGGIPGMPTAPQIRVDGPLSVSATNSARRVLRVQVDEWFRAALLPARETLPGPAPPPTGTALVAGESLRQNVASVKAFVLSP